MSFFFFYIQILVTIFYRKRTLKLYFCKIDTQIYNNILNVNDPWYVHLVWISLNFFYIKVYINIFQQL